MGRVHVHRTWPCKYQESYEVSGWAVVPSVNGDPPAKACPIHGPTCPRLPGVAGGSATGATQ